MRAIAEPMAFSFASKEGADVAVHAVHGLGCMIMEHCFDAPSSMLSLFFLITTVDTAKQAAFRGRAMWALANLVDCAYKTQASWAPLSLASEMWARLRETLILALRLAPAYEAVLFFLSFLVVDDLSLIHQVNSWARRVRVSLVRAGRRFMCCFISTKK